MFNKPQVPLGGGRHCLSLNVVEVATAAGPCLHLSEEDNEYHTGNGAGCSFIFSVQTELIHVLKDVSVNPGVIPASNLSFDFGIGYPFAYL